MTPFLKSAHINFIHVCDSFIWSVLLSGADCASLLLEWDGFVSYIECWTQALGSDVTLPIVKVREREGGRRGCLWRRKKHEERGKEQ